MKRNAYADRFKLEKMPVVDGIQYRAAEVAKQDDPCSECAAQHNYLLCHALPFCTKAKRLDGLNVRYVECGKAVRG